METAIKVEAISTTSPINGNVSYYIVITKGKERQAMRVAEKTHDTIKKMIDEVGELAKTEMGKDKTAENLTVTTNKAQKEKDAKKLQ